MQPIRRLRLHLEHESIKIWMTFLALLQPFPIRRVYTDNNVAYHKRIPAEQHTTGKRNTQKIERDHLTLRTRIKRLCQKTICFSKNEEIHRPSLAPLSMCSFEAEISMLQLYCGTTAYAKVRGTANCRKRLIHAIEESIETFCKRGWNIHIGLADSFTAPAAKEEWLSTASELLARDDIEYSLLTCSIGSHTGANAFGMAVSRRITG